MGLVRRLLIWTAIGLVVFVLLVALVIGLFLDSAVKRGVETVGPMLTKVPVKVDSVSLGVLSGSGRIKGLEVGNPQGFKAPLAISVGSARLELVPSSLLADKVVIRLIDIQAPEITFETDFKGNNLKKIRSNIEEAMGSNNQQPAKTTTNAPAGNAAAQGKKLEVDEVVISGAKFHLAVTALGGEAAMVSVPDIRFTDLGKGPEGITAAELADKILGKLESAGLEALSGSSGDLKKAAQSFGKELGKSMTNSADGISKSLGDLLKK